MTSPSSARAARPSIALPCAVALALLAPLAIGACSTGPTEEPAAELPPAIPCAAGEIGASMEPASRVRVRVDPALPLQVQTDLRDYLGRMWKGPVDVTAGALDIAAETPGDLVWISSAPRAKELTRATDGPGFALARVDEGGRKLIVAWAEKPDDLVAAAYALLEELGVRFFHPMQELVPELDGPRFPRALSSRRTAIAKTRGLQIHLLHPLEYLRGLHEPGEENFAEAKRLIDWLVKTGQNHVQWPVLGSVPWEPFAAHARRIIDYAHSRGVTVGCMVQLFEKASLQRAYVLVKDESKFDEQIDQGIAQLLTVPWDDVELAMGEFLSADADTLIRWLDTAVAKVLARSPKANVAVHNHVGNYPNLWSDYRGKRTFFYHLPQYADPRLGQTVHTLFWYDLFRPGGMYNHGDFALQRDYIFAELPRRRVRYLPESAYWVATDIDVPAFLPEFIESRWVDIHNLDAEIRGRGLPALDGHVTFSSGHEWGYWLTDYLIAKMMWEPGAPLGRFLGHYASSFGSCSEAIGADLGRVIELQRQYLFDKKLVSYVSGEDHAVDLGAAVGYELRPSRKKFDDLVRGAEPERAAFEATVLADLDAFARATRAPEAAIDARCRGSDPALAPWCNELRDGVRIVRLRVEHSVLLYRGVLAHARGNEGLATGHLALARAKTEEAQKTIAERERGYRFDVERLTGAYPNPTRYPFGYLRQAHTQCLWRRQDEQARRIIEDGTLGAGVGGLPSCSN